MRVFTSHALSLVSALRRCGERSVAASIATALHNPQNSATLRPRYAKRSRQRCAPFRRRARSRYACPRPRTSARVRGPKHRTVPVDGQRCGIANTPKNRLLSLTHTHAATRKRAIVRGRLTLSLPKSLSR